MSTVSKLNKDYWNELAASYDSKHEDALNQIIAEVRARKDLIGASWVDERRGGGKSSEEDGLPKGEEVPVRLLDYACGTGMVTRALGPYVTQCVGIDISENMVGAYNARAQNQGFSRDEMFAYQGNLTAADEESPPAFAGPEFSNFDLAAVGLGFHHFEDPRLAAERLAARLKPGGVLLIIDFLPHGHSDHSHAASHTITRHGFSEGEIRDIFTAVAAGKDFAFEEVGEIVIQGDGAAKKPMKRSVFMARGTKV